MIWVKKIYITAIHNIYITYTSALLIHGCVLCEKYNIDLWFLFCNSIVPYYRNNDKKKMYIYDIKNKEIRRYDDIDGRGSYAIHHPLEATATSRATYRRRKKRPAGDDKLLSPSPSTLCPYIIIIE